MNNLSRYLSIIISSVMLYAESDFIPKKADLIEGKLENGLTYYVLENAKPESRAELRLAVNIGAIDEDDDQQGFAHLIEHMCFNGTNKYPKSSLVEYLESIGMAFGPDLNAYTSFDETVYMLQIPTDNMEKFKSGIEILSEWAFFATLDDDELDKEKGVVIEEWRRRRGARARILDEQFPVLFEGSKYASRLPIGKMEIIKNTPNSRIKDFYNTWYKPENMAVIAVGDFNSQDVVSMIKEFFGIPGENNDIKSTSHTVPDHKVPRVIVSSDEESQYTSATISFKTDVMKEIKVDDYKEDLKEKLLFDILNKRLEEISKNNDSPFINAYSYHANTYVETKEFTIIRIITEENKLSHGIKGVMEEIARIQKFGISLNELQRAILRSSAKKKITYNDMNNIESRKLARELVSHFLISEPVPGIEWEYHTSLELYKSIDEISINNILPIYFPETSMVIQVTIPNKEDTIIPQPSEILSAVENIDYDGLNNYVDTTPTRSLISSLPPNGTIVSETYNDYIDVYDFKLSNGMRVTIKSTNFKNDEILFRGYSKGGSSLSKPENYPNSIIAADIIEESGYADFTNIELGKLLSGKVAQVKPYINNDSHGFKGKTNPEDIEIALQLLYTKFTQPNYDIEAFTNLINRYSVFVENRNNIPEVIWGNHVDKINYSNHYSKQPLSIERLHTINHMKAYSVYSELFSSPKNFHFVFVGNIDLDMIRPLLEKYLASIPNRNKNKNRYKDMGFRFPITSKNEIVVAGQEEKSRTKITFYQPTPKSNFNEQYNIMATCDILEVRLRKKLREEMSSTYHVSVGSYNMQPSSNYSTTYIAFDSAPNNVDSMVDVIFAEIDNMKNELATNDEISNIIKKYQNSRETNLEKNPYWLSRLIGCYKHSINPNDVIDRDIRISSFNAKAARKIMKKYFPKNRRTVISLYPEEKR